MLYMCLLYMYMDVTCRDTYALPYLQHSSTKAGAVVEEVAAQKTSVIYMPSSVAHCFVPLAFETSGVFSHESLHFLRDLANRIRQQNHDPLAYLKLCQRIAIGVTIQKFSTDCVLGILVYKSLNVLLLHLC